MKMLKLLQGGRPICMYESSDIHKKGSHNGAKTTGDSLWRLQATAGRRTLGQASPNARFRTAPKLRPMRKLSFLANAVPQACKPFLFHRKQVETSEARWGWYPVTAHQLSSTREEQQVDSVSGFWTVHLLQKTISGCKIMEFSRTYCS